MGLHQGLMARFLRPRNQADFEFPEIHGGTSAPLMLPLIRRLRRHVQAPPTTP